MKICLYSSQIIPTHSDLDEYGGLEEIVGLQAKYFCEQGHEVHLFACNNSIFSKEKDGSKPPGQENCHLYAIGDKGTDPVKAWKAYWDDPRTRAVLKDADIVCDHSWQYYPYAAYHELKNIAHVWHGPYPDMTTKPPFPKPNLIGVSFSHAQHLMKNAPGTVWRAVQNGIPTYKYNFNNKPIAERERLLWLSRIYPPKGPHRAIEIANALKMPLDIVGGSYGDIPEYTAHIKKMCEDSPYATFHGEVNFEKKHEFYRNAKCVLLPIDETSVKLPNGQPFIWFEPFGLITPECNASGTPIIVSPNGGLLESMRHGYNGFFANTNKEFEYFINRIDEIKPENCRKAAEQFDYKIMGEHYLKLFEDIVEKDGGW